MDIAARIAGLVQEGRALGYDVFQALLYADDRLDPGVRIPAAEVRAVAAELSRRLYGTDAAVWMAMIKTELAHRIAEPEPRAREAAAMPGWAVALLVLAALFVASTLYGGKQ